MSQDRLGQGALSEEPPEPEQRFREREEREREERRRLAYEDALERLAQIASDAVNDYYAELLEQRIRRYAEQGRAA